LLRTRQHRRIMTRAEATVPTQRDLAADTDRLLRPHELGRVRGEAHR
jgi:hypothetical protein